MSLGKCTSCDRKLTVEETTGWEVDCPACREEHHRGYLENLQRERQRLVDALMGRVREVQP